jgi:hypothetical protein
MIILTLQIGVELCRAEDAETPSIGNKRWSNNWIINLVHWKTKIMIVKKKQAS